MTHAIGDKENNIVVEKSQSETGGKKNTTRKSSKYRYNAREYVILYLYICRAIMPITAIFGRDLRVYMRIRHSDTHLQYYIILYYIVRVYRVLFF